jgi:hypothetical protein
MKPTAEAVSPTDKTTVDTHSKFAECLAKILQEPKMGNLVETGTFKGNGTTRILLESRQSGAIVYSIEVNPANYAIAQNNLAGYFDVKLNLGYTLPVELLPLSASIVPYIKRHECSDIYCDYDVKVSDKLLSGYTKEMAHKVPFDMLGKVLKRCALKPGLVLLDSAGHLGFLEFLYTVYMLRGPSYIALDDTNHVKHCDSLAYAKKRPQTFSVVEEMNEKTGWAVLKYNYKESDYTKMSEADFYKHAMRLYEQGE